MQEQREKLQAKGTYSEFKEQLDTELKKSVESFVKIGYLLKIARDTEILYESGYPSVVEFAKGEYNLSKDQVSRFIAINDKFSVDGYSDRLQDKYEGYGVAKLAEMLTLPEAVADIIEPEMTRAEIQDIKREVKEEETISDIEVMLEEKDARTEEMNLLQKFLWEYFHENRLDFIGMQAVIEGTLDTVEEDIKETLDVLAPSGIVIKKVRVAGVGKLMLSIKGEEQPLELVNVRTNEKEEYSWTNFLDDMQEVYDHGASKDDWEAYYKEPFSKVAPVQQEKEESITEQRDAKQESGSSGQIPGQMNVDDYPEVAPESAKNVDNLESETTQSIESTESDADSGEEMENVDNIAEVIPPEMPQSIEKTECDSDSEEDVLGMAKKSVREITDAMERRHKDAQDPDEIAAMAQENAEALIFALHKRDYEAASDLVSSLKNEVEMLRNTEKTE